MEWQALQAIAELVAAAGVIASLLYVAGQVRQNTRSVQAATSQDLISSLSEVTSFAAQSPFGARLYHAALLGEWSQLTAEEQSAARMFYLRSMRLFDHAYLQYRSGLLDEQAWLGWSHQIRVVAGLRGWQDVWPSFRPWLSPSFVEWVEALSGSADEATGRHYRRLHAAGAATEALIPDPRPGSALLQAIATDAEEAVGTLRLFARWRRSRIVRR